ncbi:unnamed protein product [Bursaphelenchus xylophilus]|uniref:(pine wood nematode) hypothetical protein n=1 Tax=Bursaphelenchus xylophilus TaxID=6326 RepID=A0A1I7S438_BURXY|nr:unnamed protein product [Bursaphelenchus xylophilus]CAG9116688.1 unnamed protein product [Bursaphelenchus xylophilus]
MTSASDINHDFTSASASIALPPAKYSAFRSGILRLTPDTMKCKLYCRGPNCKYCGWEYWKEDQMAIRGLYSSWITDDILAMARPTEDAMEKFDIIESFKKNNITAIFNLQSPNEHAFCGPPLHQSGFSYDPEGFMRHNVYHYNFAIPDFQFCSVETILDIVKVMKFSLNEGKIAVHCHAGLGRTGTLIACFLVLSKGMSASEALELVRSKRPNSVQSMEQVVVVGQIEDIMLRNARILPINGGYPLHSYLTWQNNFLSNEEARSYPHVPKLMFQICKRVLEFVFESSGVKFEHRDYTHHEVHNCTLGEIVVDWKNLYTKRGRAQHRYVLNVLIRLATYPFEKDEKLIQHFQMAAVQDMEKELADLDISQLLTLLHCYMLLPKKPLASRKNLIAFMEAYSPSNENKAPVVVVHKVWHCFVFFLCNVLSYLTEQNYDIVTELITFWMLGDVVNDVKQSVHGHMRDLYARNLRQQEAQAKIYHENLEKKSNQSMTCSSISSREPVE